MKRPQRWGILLRPSFHRMPLGGRTHPVAHHQAPGNNAPVKSTGSRAFTGRGIPCRRNYQGRAILIWLVQSPANRWKPALAISIKSASVISIDHRLMLRRGIISL
jgi:hypothetical protein